MENTGGKFRAKRVYFTQVSNVALRDNKLSAKAKGLYSVINSFLTMENFTLYKNALRKHMAEGNMAFDNMWKELKDKGYLIQYRSQGDKGFFYYEYELLDAPNIELATEIHGKQNRKTKEEKTHTPKSGGMEKKSKTHTPKNDGMDNTSNGEVGVYNNTDLTNTDLTNTNLSSSSDDEITLPNLTLTEVNVLVKKFKDSICELTENTKLKFLLYCGVHNTDLIKSILDYSATINIKSYAGFETIIKAAIQNNITTGEEFIQSVGQWRASKKKKPRSAATKTKDLKFNNFEGRSYDFDTLEDYLLNGGYDGGDLPV